MCLIPTCQGKCGALGTCIKPGLCRCQDTSLRPVCPEQAAGLPIDDVMKKSRPGLCQSHRGLCHHHCTDTPDQGFQCSCRRGYKLMANHRSCQRFRPVVDMRRRVWRGMQSVAGRRKGEARKNMRMSHYRKMKERFQDGLKHHKSEMIPEKGIYKSTKTESTPKELESLYSVLNIDDSSSKTSSEESKLSKTQGKQKRLSKDTHVKVSEDSHLKDKDSKTFFMPPNSKTYREENEKDVKSKSYKEGKDRDMLSKFDKEGENEDVISKSSKEEKDYVKSKSHKEQKNEDVSYMWYKAEKDEDVVGKSYTEKKDKDVISKSYEEEKDANMKSKAYEELKDKHVNYKFHKGNKDDVNSKSYKGEKDLKSPTYKEEKDEEMMSKSYKEEKDEEMMSKSYKEEKDEEMMSKSYKEEKKRDVVSESYREEKDEYMKSRAFMKKTDKDMSFKSYKEKGDEVKSYKEEKDKEVMYNSDTEEKDDVKSKSYREEKDDVKSKSYREEKDDVKSKFKREEKVEDVTNKSEKEWRDDMKSKSYKKEKDDVKLKYYKVEKEEDMLYKFHKQGKDEDMKSKSYKEEKEENQKYKPYTEEKDDLKSKSYEEEKEVVKSKSYKEEKDADGMYSSYKEGNDDLKSKSFKENKTYKDENVKFETYKDEKNENVKSKSIKEDKDEVKSLTHKEEKGEHTKFNLYKGGEDTDVLSKAYEERKTDDGMSKFHEEEEHIGEMSKSFNGGKEKGVPPLSSNKMDSKDNEVQKKKKVPSYTFPPSQKLDASHKKLKNESPFPPKLFELASLSLQNHATLKVKDFSQKEKEEIGRISKEEVEINKPAGKKIAAPPLVPGEAVERHSERRHASLGKIKSSMDKNYGASKFKSGFTSKKSESSAHPDKPATIQIDKASYQSAWEKYKDKMMRRRKMPSKSVTKPALKENPPPFGMYKSSVLQPSFKTGPPSRTHVGDGGFEPPILMANPESQKLAVPPIEVEKKAHNSAFDVGKDGKSSEILLKSIEKKGQTESVTLTEAKAVHQEKEKMVKQYFTKRKPQPDNKKSLHTPSDTKNVDAKNEHNFEKGNLQKSFAKEPDTKFSVAKEDKYFKENLKEMAAKLVEEKIAGQADDKAAMWAKEKSSISDHRTTSDKRAPNKDLPVAFKGREMLDVKDIVTGEWDQEKHKMMMKEIKYSDEHDAKYFERKFSDASKQSSEDKMQADDSFLQGEEKQLQSGKHDSKVKEVSHERHVDVEPRNAVVSDEKGSKPEKVSDETKLIFEKSEKELSAASNNLKVSQLSPEQTRQDVGAQRTLRQPEGSENVHREPLDQQNKLQLRAKMLANMRAQFSDPRMASLLTALRKAKSQSNPKFSSKDGEKKNEKYNFDSKKKPSQDRSANGKDLDSSLAAKTSTALFAKPMEESKKEPKKDHGIYDQSKLHPSKFDTDEKVELLFERKSRKEIHPAVGPELSTMQTVAPTEVPPAVPSATVPHKKGSVDKETLQNNSNFPLSEGVSSVSYLEPTSFTMTPKISKDTNHDGVVETEKTVLAPLNVKGVDNSGVKNPSAKQKQYDQVQKKIVGGSFRAPVLSPSEGRLPGLVKESSGISNIPQRPTTNQLITPQKKQTEGTGLENHSSKDAAKNKKQRKTLYDISVKMDHSGPVDIYDRSVDNGRHLEGETHGMGTSKYNNRNDADTLRKVEPPQWSVGQEGAALKEDRLSVGEERETYSNSKKGGQHLRSKDFYEENALPQTGLKTRRGGFEIQIERKLEIVKDPESIVPEDEVPVKKDKETSEDEDESLKHNLNKEADTEVVNKLTEKRALKGNGLPHTFTQDNLNKLKKQEDVSLKSLLHTALPGAKNKLEDAKIQNVVKDPYKHLILSPNKRVQKNKGSRVHRRMKPTPFPLFTKGPKSFNFGGSDSERIVHKQPHFLPTVLGAKQESFGFWEEEIKQDIREDERSDVLSDGDTEGAPGLAGDGNRSRDCRDDHCVDPGDDPSTLSAPDGPRYNRGRRILNQSEIVCPEGYRRALRDKYIVCKPLRGSARGQEEITSQLCPPEEDLVSLSGGRVECVPSVSGPHTCGEGEELIEEAGRRMCKALTSQNLCPPGQELVTVDQGQGYECRYPVEVEEVVKPQSPKLSPKAPSRCPGNQQLIKTPIGPICLPANFATPSPGIDLCPSGMVPHLTSIGVVCQFKEEPPKPIKVSTEAPRVPVGEGPCLPGQTLVQTPEGPYCGFPPDHMTQEMVRECGEDEILVDTRAGLVCKRYDSLTTFENPCPMGQTLIKTRAGEIECTFSNDVSQVPRSSKSQKSTICADGQVLHETSRGFFCQFVDSQGTPFPRCARGLVLAKSSSKFECISVVESQLRCSEGTQLVRRSGVGYFCSSLYRQPRRDPTTVVCHPGEILLVDGDSAVCRSLTDRADLCGPGFKPRSRRDGSIVCAASSKPLLECPEGFYLSVSGGRSECVPSQPHLDLCSDEEFVKLFGNQVNCSAGNLSAILVPCEEGYEVEDVVDDGEEGPLCKLTDYVEVVCEEENSDQHHIPSCRTQSVKSCDQDTTSGSRPGCKELLEMALSGCQPQCASGGRCVDGKCVCPPGVTGGACEEDINECQELPENFCENDCVNTFGSFECTCPFGSTLNNDRRTCKVIDCVPDCLNGGVCEQGTCTCPPGLTGDYCHLDVDECTSGDHHCEALCRNTFGSYGCVCPPGSRLSEDRRTCTNTTCIPECRHGGRCENHVCQCPPGFYGLVCQLDVNECRTDKHNCTHSCTNTYGSYVCSCPSGFVLAEDRRTCVFPGSIHQ
ncbi:uncharacterized protein LOC101847898 [Aplysia californica]|uniref:Uncharacterized protein LOC101847898 n=1 Tax=Aplysia californica TaxID=6500 RepID=A0ABM0K1Z0_APLCA|nr:uncharacterized protein LOC101847898 [Aplysia californica]